MMIAISSAPKTKCFTINLDSKSDEKKDEAATAITASICGKGSKLAELRILHPTIDHSLLFLTNVPQLPSLTSLEVSLPCLTQSPDFPSLANCHGLKKLVMRQVTSPESQLASSVGMWPTSVKLLEHISRPTTLGNLLFLQVECNALTHFAVARRLSPQSLVHLILEVRLDAFDDQQILIPHALTIHAARNPSLEVLEVACPLSRSMSPDSVASRRGDWQYINFSQLWASLASLKNLTALRIIDVPFLCVDILDRLLDVVISLPVLEVAVLRPRRMTDLETDKLALPPLRRLEDVSRHNAHLVRLDIAMDFDSIPTVPRGYISQSRLSRLGLGSSPEGPLGLHDFSDEELISLGRYLDRLFPHLESTSDGWEKGSMSRLLWDYVDVLFHSFQDLRAQTVLDLQAAEGNAMEVNP